MAHITEKGSQNEMAGEVALNYIHNNVNGSAGFPTIGTDIVMVSQEIFAILSPYEIGLILESSNADF